MLGFNMQIIIDRISSTKSFMILCKMKWSPSLCLLMGHPTRVGIASALSHLTGVTKPWSDKSYKYQGLFMLLFRS